jgi:hypothetical protein
MVVCPGNEEERQNLEVTQSGESKLVKDGEMEVT